MAVKGRGREGRGTSRTFRLCADEIKFLESLSGEGITAGLRKLLMFGRAAGCCDIQEGAVGTTYALIARVEKLEAQMRCQNG